MVKKTEFIEVVITVTITQIMCAKTITSKDFTAESFDVTKYPPAVMTKTLRKFLNKLNYEFGNITDARFEVLKDFMVSPIMDLDTIFERIKHKVEILDEQQERLIEQLQYSRDMFNKIIDHFNKKKNFLVIDCNMGCLQFALVSIKLVLYNLYNLLKSFALPVDLLASKSKTIEDGIHGAWHAFIYNVLLNELGTKAGNQYLIRCTSINMIKHVGTVSQIMFVDEIYIRDDPLTYLIK